MLVILNNKWFMDQAIEIAKHNFDQVVNMGVGCVIVNDGRIIGTGCRQTYLNFCGKEHKPIHAEMMALMEAKYNGEDTNGATAYCTLEPCTKRWHNTISWHFEPCCNLLVKAGIKKIVVGYLDPHFGAGGAEELKKLGLEVEYMGLDLGYLVDKRVVTKKVEHELVKEYYSK